MLRALRPAGGMTAAHMHEVFGFAAMTAATSSQSISNNKGVLLERVLLAAEHEPGKLS